MVNHDRGRDSSTSLSGIAFSLPESQKQRAFGLLADAIKFIDDMESNLYPSRKDVLIRKELCDRVQCISDAYKYKRWLGLGL